MDHKSNIRTKLLCVFQSFFSNEGKKTIRQIPKMDTADGYDYSVTKHHLQPFINPLQDKPFIDEMEDTYDTLWEFRDHISTWSFGINRWKNYVFLRYRVHGKTNYLLWNMNEKVMVIEDHQQNYIVICFVKLMTTETRRTIATPLSSMSMNTMESLILRTS